jgi:hypothetical protein
MQEIEQLRAEVERLTRERDAWKQSSDYSSDEARDFGAEIATLHAEVVRLRDVVRIAADETCSGPADNTCRAEWPDADDMWCGACRARAALAEEVE